MKYIIIPLILLIFNMNSVAQIIPVDRLTDWSHAGLTQSVVYPQKQIESSKFGLKADGITDDATALQKAINSAKKTGGVILLPAGRILIKKGISLHSNIVLKGLSAEKTHLVFDNSGAMDCISLKGSAPKSFFRLSKAPKKGERTLYMSVKPSFSAGDWLELRQKNGSWDVNPRDWAEYSVGQIVQVVKISGNQIHLSQPIRIDYDVSLEVEVGQFIPTQNSGIEQLSIERFSQPNTGLNYNISFQYTVNSWIKGVEGKKSAGSHVHIEQSGHIEISGSYFHHAFNYSGSSTKGYGVIMSVHTGDCLVENNIFNNLRHSMMLKQGANGNVIAYNYSISPKRSEFISAFSGDISLHGHYPFANLIEGNIIQNVIIDKYWGMAGPDNTFLRNRAELYGIIYTSAQSGNKHNILGNEIVNKGWFMGNLTVAGTNHIVKCNQLKRSGTCSDSLPKSFFYLKTPRFWNISDGFPTIGDSFNQGSIPAKKRFENGELTIK